MSACTYCSSRTPYSFRDEAYSRSSRATDSSHRLRLTVMVPPDKVTDNRAMSFFVDCDTTFTVDNVKWTLLNQIYSTTGKAPRISSFQLQQEGQHLPYTQQRILASSRAHPFNSCVLHLTATSKTFVHCQL